MKGTNVPQIRIGNNVEGAEWLWYSLWYSLWHSLWALFGTLLDRHCSLQITSCNWLQPVFDWFFIFPKIGRLQLVASPKLGNRNRWSSCRLVRSQSGLGFLLVLLLDYHTFRHYNDI